MSRRGARPVRSAWNAPRLPFVSSSHATYLSPKVGGVVPRFHAVHHSAEHLDWLAAHREHPLDTIYTVGIINLPAFILGFPLETLAGFIAFRGVWAIYIHSNVRLPIGPLRVLLGGPELHHWHHDRDRDAGNYTNLSPLMDVLFGTYRCPDHEPARLGINQPTPRNYLAHMIWPFLPGRLAGYLAGASPSSGRGAPEVAQRPALARARPGTFSPAPDPATVDSAPAP